KGDKYFQKKIVVRQLGENINAALDERGEYVTIQSTYNLVPKANSEYVLGILNSKLINWYYVKLFREKELFPRVLIENLRIIPIVEPKSPSENKIADKISKLVLKLTENYKKKDENRVLELENEIDELVYGLYGVTDEERRTIERGA
ncbi:hypothetical protein COU36_02260, partial [Candidatus Micrarchaeota archaeon CG10_big_fil_rev_8_21_14_0_10_59_7]